MRVRGIAFDLFHTLVDPEDFRPPEFRRAREVARLLGLGDPSGFESFWSADLADRKLHRSPSVVDRVRRYCSARGIRPADAVWDRVADALGRYTDQALRSPRRSVLDTARGLRTRGLTLGVISNCDELEVRAWPESPLNEVMDCVVFSCDIGFAKPSVEAYRALERRWGDIGLGEAVFVGDGSNDELEGARRAGFAHVVFDQEFVAHNGLRSPEANALLRTQADATIDRLGQLPHLLAAW